jgi:mono/diheme cytochrome c family protein
VATVLASRCSSCHGDPQTGGAPMRLETRDDLLATSPTYGVSYADRSVTRMTSSTSPMPPTGIPPASETAALQNWIAAGKPFTTCSQVIDAGTPPDAGPAPTVCTSGSYWTFGDQQSADMNPGLACKACHATRAAFKNYPYMGTVFPTQHEQDKCNAMLPVTVTVEVFDATGRVLQSTTASGTSGNFHMGVPILQQPAPWYRARVKANGKVLEMQTPVTTKNGDCNTCHTEQGANGAPGRIVYPQ